jgi:hypothetical protein
MLGQEHVLICHIVIPCDKIIYNLLRTDSKNDF